MHEKDGSHDVQIKEWMDKGEHYQVEIKGWTGKGGIMMCKLKERMDKGQFIDVLLVFKRCSEKGGIMMSVKLNTWTV